MWLREELLKSIWHAFTALDVDQRGKVSKSQLKVRFTSVFCGVEKFSRHHQEHTLRVTTDVSNVDVTRRVYR